MSADRNSLVNSDTKCVNPLVILLSQCEKSMLLLVVDGITTRIQYYMYHYVIKYGIGLAGQIAT